MCNKKSLLVWQPLLSFVLLANFHSFAQIKWDGGAGDNQWMTAANWSGDILPGVTDDVILDNSIVAGSYTVVLPAGSILVQVRSVNITPATGNTIELHLPVTSTAVPALKISGTVYGMIIGNGGIFKNSSGADSGSTVIISDSLKINNGGRYIQNSVRSHAAIVMVLSKAPGTEEGIFEFDIPTASSTVSLSGRTYGKLLFSSTAMNGPVTYSGAGVNRCTVKSDLQTGPGVTVSLNLDDTLFIGRDLIQQGGTINLGNASRTLVAAINRHWVQAPGAVICETGIAFPQIILNGSSNQQVDCKGVIKDSITITMNNAAGATLVSPLRLPYLLNLVQGKITSTSSNLLSLLPGCSLKADSLAGACFIDGPLRRENVSAGNNIFPVGKGTAMHWLALKNASGHYTVEYVNSNPQQLSNNMGPGIDHISNIEYWTIQADASPIPSASVELSFNEPNSGVGPDLSTYQVARLINNTWMNAGNTAVTGTAGSRGSVVSNIVNEWSSSTEYFTLGSSQAANGPLALADPAPFNRTPTASRIPWLQLLSISSAVSPVLTCRAYQKMQVQFIITDIMGRPLKTMVCELEKGVNRLPVVMATLPAGIYSIQGFTSKGPSNTLRFAAGIWK